MPPKALHLTLQSTPESWKPDGLIPALPDTGRNPDLQLCKFPFSRAAKKLETLTELVKTASSSVSPNYRLDSRESHARAGTAKLLSPCTAGAKMAGARPAR